MYYQLCLAFLNPGFNVCAWHEIEILRMNSKLRFVAKSFNWRPFYFDVIMFRICTMNDYDIMTV